MGDPRSVAGDRAVDVVYDSRMALSDRLQSAVLSLLGASAYQPGQPPAPVPNSTIESIRRTVGGNIQPMPITRLRWYMADLESAQSAADTGNLAPAAQLVRAIRRDGYATGLRNTRTKGLIRLPKRYFGDQVIADDLRARNGTRSKFDDMHPPSELRALDGDGIELGVGIAERVPVVGRTYPILVRLNPENLQYRWSESRWYFQSIAGALPITPGDGRWVLHTPGGLQEPWNGGIWPAIGRAFINKEHAVSYRANYIATLANPARIAHATLGASEPERQGMLQRLLAWGVNQVMEMPVGWDVSLLESNGIAQKIFQDQIDAMNQELMVAYQGQLVSTQGNSGLGNSEGPDNVKQDFIQDDGDALSFTLNTQSVALYIAEAYGIDALYDRATIFEWDTMRPLDKDRESRILNQYGQAIQTLTATLAPYDQKPAVRELNSRFGVPTEEGAAAVVALGMTPDMGGASGASVPGRPNRGESLTESEPRDPA